MSPMAVGPRGTLCAAHALSGPGPLAGAVGTAEDAPEISDRLLPLPTGETDTRLSFRRQ